MLPTTATFSPFPIYTEINTLKPTPNWNLAHSLRNANTQINNLNYANMNQRFAICSKKLEELMLTHLSMPRHYSHASGLVSSFLKNKPMNALIAKASEHSSFEGLVAYRTSKSGLVPIRQCPSDQKGVMYD